MRSLHVLSVDKMANSDLVSLVSEVPSLSDSSAWPCSGTSFGERQDNALQDYLMLQYNKQWPIFCCNDVLFVYRRVLHFFFCGYKIWEHNSMIIKHN